MALIGRINRIKGQDVLIAALSGLPDTLRSRVEARMVGGAFENPALEAGLREAVARAGLGSQVSVEPFAADTAPIYRWADIVVAPSKLPELLGRTAIEAMAYGRPALVSSIGGLTEVVANGETGWHVPPGDASALSAKLADIVARPEAWRDFGRAGRARYERLFSRRAASSALAAVVAAQLGARSLGATSQPTLAAKAP